MTKKKCTLCNTFKEKEEFYPKKNKNGRIYLTSFCKKCHAIYHINYISKYHKSEHYKEVKKIQRKNWMLDPIVKERVKLKNIESRQKNIKTSMINMARKRALKNNLEFNITKEDIIIPEVCPILQIPFIFGNKVCYSSSPSLDRIDNTKGYIKGNVAVISMLANSMKNVATKEQIKVFCKNVLIYINNDDIVQTV